VERQKSDSIEMGEIKERDRIVEIWKGDSRDYRQRDNIQL